ncbi:MAG: UDP-glucose 4-epimerase GalE [Nitrospirota bacterium]|nr:UDP-glucose 4-epimerase GalE [Nitrospirota bacterium]
MKVLVAGGAGYIGAHVVRALAQHGHTPIILDDLRSSSENRTEGYLLEKVALEEVDSVFRVFKHHRPEAIVHLGGYISVGESVKVPAKYWENNLGAGVSLILACGQFPVRTVLFSSTAAVYGNVTESPIPEESTLSPTSPYGESKLAFERVLHSSARAVGFRSIALRYFNASGANQEWGVGEAHDPEEHLIPRVIRALLAGNPVQVYGNDYPTPDGTCIRDYIHVTDLAEAHVLALETEHLESGQSFNVGTGKGHSVLEVIHAIARHLSYTPRIDILSRRPGDPPILVANPSTLMTQLKWEPEHSNLDEIVSSAIAWEKSRNGVLVAD